MSNLEAMKGQSTHGFLKVSKNRCTRYLHALTTSTSDISGGKNLVTFLFFLIPIISQSKI